MTHDPPRDTERVRILKVTPTVGVGRRGQEDPTTGGARAADRAGDTPPTVEDIRRLEGRELSPSELGRYGHVEWQGERQAYLHAGGMTFALKVKRCG